MNIGAIHHIQTLQNGHDNVVRDAIWQQQDFIITCGEDGRVVVWSLVI